MTSLVLEHIPRSMRWRTYKPFEFLGIEVPVNYETDLATAPRVFWSFFPPSGPYAEAAVIHDYCYTHLYGQMSKAEADGLFLAGLKELDIPVIQRKIMHQAVKIGGTGRW